MNNKEWFKQAKYGMMIHWGLYSLPAGEWRGRRMEDIGEWCQQYFRIPNKEYHKLAEIFNPIYFDADEWVKLAKDAGVIVRTVERAWLDQLYPAHQGMLAYVAAVPYTPVEDMLAAAREKGEDPFLVALDGVMDPHNLGAIIRSAECAGAHGVIIPERRSAGLSPTAAKAAAGALSHMPVAQVGNLNRTLEDLKTAGLWVTGAAMDGEDAFACDLTGPIALVIGSEGDGISRLTLEKCDRVVSLPVRGHIDSLNASVAAGVLMYEIVRQRGR